MTTPLPSLTPRFSTQPPDVAWPTRAWTKTTSPRHGELETLVDALFDDPHIGVTNAVVIIQRGEIIFERYGGVREFFDRDPEPITATSPLLSWSMAKSVLHFLVGTLIDEGRLDLAQRSVAPEWREALDPRGAITLDDLLMMRDGLDFVEIYEVGERSDVIEMLFGEGKGDVAGFAAARPLAHEPGSYFSYSSGTSNIISRLVADTVGHGDAYQEFLRERLLLPLNMASAEATFDDTGVFVASSYLHASALDFAKFGLLYLRGGEWDGRQLVSREWTLNAQVPLSRDEESGHYYAKHWWVSGDPYGTYWASGYEGQMISVVPALDALVLRFGHTSAEHYPALYAWRRRVLDVLAKS
ncbi:MAG TPA: serine hydrolase [Acidimicrobiales bacterium]|nr:serine hydrolase [Acidimicrobiales bacterium]